jgi:hypothetical protein
VRQALDLQAMQGTLATVPLLFMETGGIALLPLDQLRSQTGLVGSGPHRVLLVSPRRLALQLLQHG